MTHAIMARKSPPSGMAGWISLAFSTWNDYRDEIVLDLEVVDVGALCKASNEPIRFAAAARPRF